jgi:DNA-binding MarR family transcriptional regulator
VTATATGARLRVGADQAAQRAEAAALAGLTEDEIAQPKALLRKALWGRMD